MKKIIIAVDGYSSCGKSTMAKDLAKEIGYVYIDTGAMYRTVTLYCIQNGLFQGNEIDVSRLEKEMDKIDISLRFNPLTGRPDAYLKGVNVEKEIRSMEVANKVSLVSTLGFVRKALVAKQQKMGKAKGIVMDGRDIGTVVFPEAELKIFVTASPEIRAMRRVKELDTKGESASFEEVLENVKTRDQIDTTRKESPLRQADDAVVLDNSYLTIEEQKQWLLEQYHKVISKLDYES
ncbi:(d)CMP kinase [Parabacteroides pacaensis]|uniref:(d)CMP kinase n=1 Tax=Parabacteroides pacaensis TaxID=2086575 RepID=UPI000D0F8406|nr:(d)CMP kinase [Parabacteroides pacaensis]